MHDTLTTKNLIEAINQNLDGYKLKFLYSLEVKHNGMGYFPALMGGTKEIVYCTNLAVLKKVWSLLPPRSSKIHTVLFYVNSHYTEGFPITFKYGSSMLDPENCMLTSFVTRERFDQLIADSALPFQWQLGVSGASCDQDSFKRLIDEGIASACKEIEV